MKKFFISFVLIISLLFNVFADNKQAHKELRKEFEKCIYFDEIKNRDPDFLNKLDKIDDLDEMRDYLQSIFIDENGMPLDNHAMIDFLDKDYNFSSVKATSQLCIDFSDEYGSKDELLKKGYKEDEIFYYPYFNGEWKGGYRVGKKFMGGWAFPTPKVNSWDSSCYIINNPGEFIIESKEALLVRWEDFLENHPEVGNAIKSSKKKYLIIDLSKSGGGYGYIYNELVKNIKIMKPKKIFVLSSHSDSSMADRAILNMEKSTGIKTIIIGQPTQGAWRGAKVFTQIQFDDFEIEVQIKNPDDDKEDYSIQLPEGIGAMPDIYTLNTVESLEVVKYLIGDNELSLPEKYKKQIIEREKYRKMIKYSK